MIVFAAVIAALFVLAMLASCSGAPASMCLLNCTVVVRTDSAGDDSITSVEQAREKARDALKRFEHKDAPPRAAP